MRQRPTGAKCEKILLDIESCLSFLRLIRYRRAVRRILTVVPLLIVLVAVLPASAGVTGRVVKVLPQFLDLKGRHALTPSLYDRDAYQNYLRHHPEKISGMRYQIKWKASGATNAELKLRVELLSDATGKVPARKTIEQQLPSGSRGDWTSLFLSADEYKQFGSVTAWRVTLWDGEKMLAEQKSFLW
jgi:hypothetical protein